MTTEYRNVRLVKGKIVGQQRTRFDDSFSLARNSPMRHWSSWFNFSATPELMKVSIAMERSDDVFRSVLALADGYGEPGYFPSGYDWSGVRDSTPTAVSAMAAVANRWAERVRYRWPWLSKPGVHGWR